MLVNPFISPGIDLLMTCFSEDSWLFFDDTIVQLCLAHGNDEGWIFDRLSIIVMIVFDLSFDWGQCAIAKT